MQIEEEASQVSMYGLKLNHVTVTGPSRDGATDAYHKFITDSSSRKYRGDALQRVFMTSSGNRNFDILMNFILFSHVLNLGRVLNSITGLDIRVNTAGLTD